jgi:hypothetical protein
MATGAGEESVRFEACGAEIARFASDRAPECVNRFDAMYLD